MEDETGDNLEAVPHLDLLSLHAREDDTSIYLALTLAGDIYRNPWGSYLIYIDTTQDEQGADVDVGKRPILAADPYRPEFRLDILAIDRKGTVSGSYQLNVWDGVEWQIVTMTNGRAIQSGTPSVIEIELLKSLLGNPSFANMSVVSTGRGRVHTAGDILGTNVSPASWEEAVLLDSFIRIELTP